MLSRLVDAGLKKFGVSQEQAQSGMRIAFEELRAVGSDLLASTIEHQARSFMREQLLTARNGLLKNIAGDPPPGFILRLRARGYDKMTELQAYALWADVVASIAELPAPPAEEEVPAPAAVAS